MRKRIGDKRAREGFLFFPKTIYSERRWWEYAKWLEERDNLFEWYPVCWVNE